MDNIIIQNGGSKPYGIGYTALQLAMTRTLAEESELKNKFTGLGFQVVVTEVGGSTRRDFKEKIIKAVQGAAINEGLIKKEPHELHSLFHAADEAMTSTIVNLSSEANLAVKIALVRKEHWIAVAIFGESAIHPMTGHERCGLGVMNI